MREKGQLESEIEELERSEDEMEHTKMVPRYKTKTTHITRETRNRQPFKGYNLHAELVKNPVFTCAYPEHRKT